MINIRRLVMYKVKCDICGNEFYACNIKQHMIKHYNGNYEKSLRTQHVTHEGLICIYCGKECKNKRSLAQHECRCSKNPNHIPVINPFKGHTP